MTWTQTITSDKLKGHKPALFKHSGKHIAIWRKGDQLHAFDNRCPHEGYPLREGSISENNGDCVLTCNWHNWKFRLKTGENLGGDDALRTYPAKIEDGHVWLDLSDPPPEQRKAEHMTALRQAFDKRSYDRIARVLAKLDLEGFDTREAVAAAVTWSADRYEYGMSHAYAASADWLALSAESDDRELRLTALNEAIDHMAEDVLRRPAQPFSDARIPFDGQTLITAIEAEDEPTAIALVNDWLDGEGTLDQLFQPLAKAALAHYMDFGHAVIYVDKARQLITQLGRYSRAPVACALVRALVQAYREDLLPEFRDYGPALAQAQAIAYQTQADDTPLQSPFGMSVKGALAWTLDALKVHTPQQVYQALLKAAARNLLAYDTHYQWRFDQPAAQNFGWLGVSHGITFANALRHLAEQDPELWRPGLLQMALFIGRAKSFLLAEPEAVEAWAIDEPTFHKEAQDQVLDHGIGLNIYSAHYLKTWLAAKEEGERLDPPTRQLLNAGVRRFLQSGIKQKHLRRTMRQALALFGRDH